MKSKKLIFSVLVVALTLCLGMFAFAACDNSNSSSSSSSDPITVSLSQTEASIIIGDTVTLTATVSPDGTSTTWASSDTSVATVRNGVVTGKSAGTATITVTAGGEATATCTVTVSGVEVTISQTTAALELGDSVTLTATAADGGDITWSSSDSTVASVENGVVTGLKDGTATITASRGSAGSASCEVTVTWSGKPDDYVEVSFGEESVSVADPGTWYYWNDQDWCGAYVTVSSAAYYDGALHITYADNNSSWANYGMQIFYTAPDNVQGTTYTVTCTITSDTSGMITVLGNVITLEAGVAYEFSCEFVEGTTYGGSSFSIQCGTYADEAATEAVNLEAATLIITTPVFTTSA